MRALWVVLGCVAVSWLVAWIGYHLFAHPPTWYEDLPPKGWDHNEDE